MYHSYGNVDSNKDDPYMRIQQIKNQHYVSLPLIKIFQCYILNKRIIGDYLFSNEGTGQKQC